jgi:hypothetical protein
MNTFMFKHGSQTRQVMATMAALFFLETAFEFTNRML